MTYKVVWLRDSSPIGSEPFEQLDEAKNRAQAELDRMRARFGATAVKVVDDCGAPCFLNSVEAR